MAKKRARRHHGGSIRALASGRWQVRVHDRATGRHVTLGTFPTKEDANAALAAAVASTDLGLHRRRLCTATNARPTAWSISSAPAWCLLGVGFS